MDKPKCIKCDAVGVKYGVRVIGTEMYTRFKYECGHPWYYEWDEDGNLVDYKNRGKRYYRCSNSHDFEEDF